MRSTRPSVRRSRQGDRLIFGSECVAGAHLNRDQDRDQTKNQSHVDSPPARRKLAGGVFLALADGRIPAYLSF